MKHKLITMGALGITALPLITLVACSQEPTKINPTIPAQNTFSYSKEITLTNETDNAFATALEQYNSALQTLIDTETTKYFFETADIVGAVNNSNIKDLNATKAILEIFFNYVYNFSKIDLTLKLNFADNTSEELKDNIDLLHELEITSSIINNINVSNVSAILGVFKHNLIDMDNFKEDQYEAIKKSPIMQAYVDSLGSEADLLLYDFSDLSDQTTLSSYKIYWSTPTSQADRIFDKLNSNFRIY